MIALQAMLVEKLKAVVPINASDMLNAHIDSLTRALDTVYYMNKEDNKNGNK